MKASRAGIILAALLRLGEAGIKAATERMNTSI